MANLEKLAKERNFHGMVIASVITALAFVAGLFWRDFAQQLIDEIIPAGEGLLYTFIVAVVVTVLIVIIIIFLVKTEDWKNAAIEQTKKLQKMRKKRRKKSSKKK